MTGCVILADIMLLASFGIKILITINLGVFLRHLLIKKCVLLTAIVEQVWYKTDGQ